MSGPEDQRRDEAKFFLAAIVESSRDSIVTVDFHGVITSWNKAAEQLYGYSAEEAIGQELVQLTLPQNLSEVLGNIQKVKHSQKVEVFDSVRINCINKGGHEMHLEVSMSPVFMAVCSQEETDEGACIVVVFKIEDTSFTTLQRNLLVSVVDSSSQAASL
jgi:PAS domain S-box-containing protein